MTASHSGAFLLGAGTNFVTSALSLLSSTIWRVVTIEDLVAYRREHERKAS